MADETTKITIVNDVGEEVECEVLFTFQKEAVNYIVYTDGTVDENGCTKVYASVYDPAGEDMRLRPIETEEEWTLIEKLLQQMQDMIENGEVE